MALSLYREKRRNQPKLPKSREEVFAALETMDIVTNKDENMLAALSRDDDIAIFTSSTNIECLCSDVTEIFIDGTFKCCPNFFLSNVHYSWCNKWELCAAGFCFVTVKNGKLLHENVEFTDL